MVSILCIIKKDTYLISVAVYTAAMASDQESSDEEPDSEMLSDDLCLPDSDDDKPNRNVQVSYIITFQIAVGSLQYEILLRKHMFRMF